MGKLMHNTQIKHSSHPHILQLSSNLHLQNQACAGCNLHISAPDHVYTCTPCNFFLHSKCSEFPELITHPAHRQHTLSLLPTSIYPGGFFRCDACTQQGNRFSYHCQICDFDLHVLCASKPLSVTHPTHPHPLLLTFSSPYGDKSGFSCDLCRSIGSSDQWLYRCTSCEFDVHLHCATTKMPPPLQHHHSFPAAAIATHPNQFSVPPAAQPLAHSISTGHVQSYWQPSQTPAPVGVQAYQRPQQTQTPAAVGVQSYQMQQQPPAAVGVQSYQMQQQPPAAVGVQSYQMQPQPQGQGPAVQTQSMGNVMMTGFVDGMMQQLGQNFVQGLTGGDGGDVVNIDIQSSNTNENYETSDSTTE